MESLGSLSAGGAGLPEIGEGILALSNERSLVLHFACLAFTYCRTVKGMRFDRESWTEWFVVFVPCFVIFNVLAEVGLSWIVFGVAMMLITHFQGPAKW